TTTRRAAALAHGTVGDFAPAAGTRAERVGERAIAHAQELELLVHALEHVGDLGIVERVRRRRGFGCRGGARADGTHDGGGGRVARVDVAVEELVHRGHRTALVGGAERADHQLREVVHGMLHSTSGADSDMSSASNSSYSSSSQASSAASYATGG